jgi:hypothetical protein
MHTTCSVETAPLSHLLGEEFLDRFFRAVLTYPQQHPTFQIVDHRQINLPFPPAHFIHADHMHRRPLAIP